MSIQSQATIMKNDSGHSLVQQMISLCAGLSEPFWFCVSFFLFLLMGPFSVIAVIIGLCSLASEENRNKMKEPASV